MFVFAFIENLINLIKLNIFLHVFKTLFHPMFLNLDQSAFW